MPPAEGGGMEIIMEKQLMVVYKFGSKFGGDLSSKEGLNLYELHA